MGCRCHLQMSPKTPHWSLYLVPDVMSAPGTHADSDAPVHVAGRASSRRSILALLHCNNFSELSAGPNQQVSAAGAAFMQASCEASCQLSRVKGQASILANHQDTCTNHVGGPCMPQRAASSQLYVQLTCHFHRGPSVGVALFRLLHFTVKKGYCKDGFSTSSA